MNTGKLILIESNSYEGTDLQIKLLESHLLKKGNLVKVIKMSDSEGLKQYKDWAISHEYEEIDSLLEQGYHVIVDDKALVRDTSKIDLSIYFFVPILTVSLLKDEQKKINRLEQKKSNVILCTHHKLLKTAEEVFEQMINITDEKLDPGYSKSKKSLIN